MEQLKLEKVVKYVEENIGTFHQKRIDRLNELKLNTVLKKKNPYLFKAKHLLTSEKIVRSLTDAFISSNEETIFGDWLEGLAIFINNQVYGGWKSGINGIDLEFDKDGENAKSGKLNENLFGELIKHDKFIERTPPKSTGREFYGESFLANIFQIFKNIPKEDWLHTVTKFTSYGIFKNYELFVKQETEIDELIISGGGAKNKFLYECLCKDFGTNVEIKIIDDIGISSDAKEAVCFAVLANETISGNPTNIPRTTGASRPTILGKICLP